MNQPNAPGKTLLLVVGILLVIFSVISLIVLIPTFVLLAPALSLGALGVLLLVAVLLSCATVIIDLIAGIMGIVNREKPEKAKVCMSLGITMISITVLNIIFTIISSDFNFFNAVFGLVLPVLYTLGAAKNKNAASAAPYQANAQNMQ